MSDELEVLRRYLAKRLHRKIPAAVMNHSERDRLLVAEVVEDPNLSVPIRQIGALSFSRDPAGLDHVERDRLRRAEETLEGSKKYQEWRAHVEERLDFVLVVNRERRPRTSGVTRTPNAYVDSMAPALSLRFEGEDQRHVAATPPLVGGFRDGLIWIEADPWVPRKTVCALYRALQEHIGPPAREVLRPKSIELFLWVRERRHRIDERWRDTMEAWNREHTKQYTRESNFHRDYHRFKEAFEELRDEVDRLREEAISQEAKEADWLAEDPYLFP